MYIGCFICSDSHVWQQNKRLYWFLQLYKSCFHFCQMRLIQRQAHYFLGFVFANISAHPTTHASTSDIRSSLLGKISERSTRVKDLPRDRSLDSRCYEEKKSKIKGPLGKLALRTSNALLRGWATITVEDVLSKPSTHTATNLEAFVAQVI